MKKILSVLVFAAAISAQAQSRIPAEPTIGNYLEHGSWNLVPTTLSATLMHAVDKNGNTVPSDGSGLEQLKLRFTTYTSDSCHRFMGLLPVNGSQESAIASTESAPGRPAAFWLVTGNRDKQFACIESPHDEDVVLYFGAAKFFDHAWVDLKIEDLEFRLTRNGDTVVVEWSNQTEWLKSHQNP